MDGQKIVVHMAGGREASLALLKYKKTLTTYRAGYAKTKMYSRYGWWTRSGLFRGEHRHIATYKGGAGVSTLRLARAAQKRLNASFTF